MICTVDVLSMFVPCLFQYYTLCDVQILPCPAQFHQYQQQTYNTWLRISLEMLPICYFWWMLTLLYLTCLSMYLRRVITTDAFVCRRCELHPMSYSISHNFCNCSLTSTIYWLPVGTHISGTDPRFDPEEQLASAAADVGQALAKMKCPSNYLLGLTKYVLTSSILPIPVAINGYVLYDWCIKHVLVNMTNTFLLLSLPFYRHLGHYLLWEHLPCDV